MKPTAPKTKHCISKSFTKYPALFSSKKAVLFTVIVLIILSVLLFSLTVQTESRLREKRLSLDARISSVDHFISDIERDIERGLYIASFRALLGIQQEMTETGEYFTNFNGTFSELVINGSINGSYQTVIDNAELNEWVGRIAEKADALLIVVNYSIKNVSVSHVSPWVLAVELDIDLNITDTKGTSSWDRASNITSFLNIEGFEDPLYTINSRGSVIKTIKKSNVTTFVIGTNASELVSLVSNTYYLSSNISPSYLQRLEGDLSASPYGIESLVNLQEFEVLEQYGIDIHDDCSIVDFVYFGPSCSATPSYLINNTYSWFRLDDMTINSTYAHLDLYDARALVIPG